MSALTFDTLKFAKTLTAAGVPTAYAEAEAVALANAFAESEQAANLATKQDLAVVKAELEVKIAETKSELIRWVVGVGMLQTAMIAGLLMKLIPT